MSQDQPRKPEQGQAGREPIKYGDVFDDSGDLASKPITPQDAAMMQTAEAVVFGQTQKGGPAAVMQSAATRNERAGLVGRDVTDVVMDQGVTVTETDVRGQRIITESVAGQIVGQYAAPTPVQHAAPAAAVEQSAITIGEALEVAAQMVGGKLVDQSDAATIQAAEVRATGSNVISPGGLAASAQSAAAHNEGVDRDEEKIKLGDVLTGAMEKLPADKVATRQDAKGVASAELRNNPDLVMQPGGVAASVAAAARLNKAVNPRDKKSLERRKLCDFDEMGFLGFVFSWVFLLLPWESETARCKVSDVNICPLLGWCSLNFLLPLLLFQLYRLWNQSASVPSYLF